MESLPEARLANNLIGSNPACRKAENASGAEFGLFLCKSEHRWACGTASTKSVEHLQSAPM